MAAALVFSFFRKKNFLENELGQGNFGCAPAPGSYDPKFDTDLSITANKGNAFSQLGRFAATASTGSTGFAPHPTPLSLPGSANSSLMRSYSSSSLYSVPTNLGSARKRVQKGTALKGALKTKVSQLDETEIAYLDAQSVSRDLEIKENESMAKNQIILDLKKTVVQVQEELEGLRKRHDDLTIDRNDLQTDILKKSQEHHQAREMLTKTLDEQQHEIIQLKDSSKHNSYRLNECTQEIEQMREGMTTEIDELKVRNAENQEEIEGMREDLLLKSNQVKDLAQLNERNSVQIAEQLNCIHQLEDQCKKSTEQHLDLLKEMTTEIDKLNAQNQEEIERIREELIFKSNQVQDLAQVNERNLAQMADHLASMHELEDQNKKTAEEHNELVKKLETEIYEFKERHAENKEEIEGMRKELLLKSNQVQELTQVNERNLAQMADQLASIQQLEDQRKKASKENLELVKKLETEIDEFKERHAENEEEIEGMRKELLLKSDQVQELTQVNERNLVQITDQLASIRQLENEGKNMKEDHLELVKRMKTEMDEYKARSDENQDEIGRLQEIVQLKSNEIQDLSQSVESNLAQISEDKEMIQALENNNRKLTEDNLELSENVQAKNAKLETMKELVEEFMDKTIYMKEVITKAYGKKKELIIVSSECEKLQETVQSQAETLRKKIAFARHFEDQCRILSAKLESQVIFSRNVQQELDEKNRLAAKSQEEFDDLRLQFGTLQNENEKLTSTLQTLEAFIEPYKGQLEAYKMEMLMEKERKMKSETQCKELFTKYAELLGHQNKKQKIHHIIKLKEDNVKTRKEVHTLRLDLARAKQLIVHLQPRRFDRKAAFGAETDNEKENTVPQPIAQ